MDWRTRFARATGALLITLALAGCSTWSATRSGIEAQLAAGHYDEALRLHASRSAPARDQVLHLLDQAMLERLSGDHRASNASFEAAKQLIDELSAVSVTETSGSFFINDATTAYVGEPFERALLHAYAALNYLDLGEHEAARVEALQVDLTLRALAEDADGALATDPFSRYLAGIIYELRGEVSDALISYRKAYQAYQAHGKLYPITVPSVLKDDLLRLTAHVGLHDEHRRFREAFARDDGAAPPAHAGEVIVLLHNGLAPIKRERRAVLVPPQAPQVVSIALPEYQPRPSPVAAARVTVAGREARTETVEDVSAIAVHTLAGRIPAITARSMARVVAKFAASEGARRENQAAGLLVNLAGLLTERADTRSWLTLPGEIQLARVPVPAGMHTLLMELLSETGAVIDSSTLTVNVAEGGKAVVSRHWIPSVLPTRSP